MIFPLTATPCSTAIVKRCMGLGYAIHTYRFWTRIPQIEHREMFVDDDSKSLVIMQYEYPVNFYFSERMDSESWG